MTGIVIMDKSAGMTSFKALGVIKRAYGTKRVGHTGTLDPDATGVLPVLIGKATRASELIAASEKEYIAVIKLGVKTDTLDLSGKVISERMVNVTENDVLEVCKSFVGEISQLPPMYSAISVNGQRLYDLARKGETAEREERQVFIEELEVCDISLPFVTIRVHCSKGTYIRTLADDIGEALGCGGAISTLRRTLCGDFDISMAHTPEEICENPEGCLLPIDTVFSSWERLDIDSRLSRLVRNGVSPYFDGEIGSRYRVYDENGEFLALSEVKEVEEDICLCTIKGFY